MKAITIAAAALLAAAALAGCATSGPGDYSQREARGVATVSYGTVESVRPVKLNEDHAPVGTVAGAAIGGIAGSTLGHGSGGALGTVLGALGGGLAGNAIEHKATQQDGEEIIVRLDNGQTIAVVQGGFQDFAAGQRVRVLSGSQRTRVEHA
jgi:outer membrane lipoprotein SlyB